MKAADARTRRLHENYSGELFNLKVATSEGRPRGTLISRLTLHLEILQLWSTFISFGSIKLGPMAFIPHISYFPLTLVGKVYCTLQLSLNYFCSQTWQ